MQQGYCSFVHSFGFKSLLEERKVCILMSGISDSCLEAAKKQVLATPLLRQTFEAPSNFIVEAMDNKVSYSAPTRKSQISAVN